MLGAIMSTVVRLGRDRFYSRTNSNYDNYAAILKILSNSDPSEVMQDWLVGTREWKEIDPGKPTKDLLNVFMQQMKKLVKQGVLNRDAVYERAINFVEELRARREAISYSSLGDNPSA